MKEKIAVIAEKLADAMRVVVFTGAGVSKESGVPTFRDTDGLWAKFKPEELANFAAFMRNPDMVTEWYSHRRKLMSEVKPNAGHYAIAEMEEYFPEFCVITQNVDNLHRRAGSKKVYELHGNIERNYCINCGKYYNLENIFPKEALKCDCGGLIRPDVVWFGEMLPHKEFSAADEAARTCDVFFTIGTSALVYPAAELPYIAKNHGAFTVEINIGATEFTPYSSVSLFGKSGEILPEILKSYKEILGEKKTPEDNARQIKKS